MILLLGKNLLLRYNFLIEEHPLSTRDVIVHSDPEILGGTPVFVGTRVPLRNLIDYFEEGYSLDEFLDDFPSVTRDQVLAVLESAHEVLTAGARSAR